LVDAAFFRLANYKSPAASNEALLVHRCCRKAKLSK